MSNLAPTVSLVFHLQLNPRLSTVGLIRATGMSRDKVIDAAEALDCRVYRNHPSGIPRIARNRSGAVLFKLYN